MKKILRLSVIVFIFSLSYVIGMQVNATNENISNGDNPGSIKYLVTDNFISRVLPKTTISEFKENFLEGEVVKVYEDEACTKEVEYGYVYSGMYAKNEYNGRVFKISVLGDIQSEDKEENNINGDGILNQIELTRIIREYVKTEGWNITQDIERESADVTCDKIVDKDDIKSIIKYIVYGGIEEKKVKNVESPKVEIVEGRKTEDGKYVNSVKVKITQMNKEDETLKTVYKITGSKETEYKEIDGTEKTIEIDGRGVYKVIAYTYGTLENKSKGASQVIKMTKEYTVTFYDENGTTILGTSTVEYGKDATYTGNTPTKEATAQYTYTFNGWDDETKLENVTENRSVKATYSVATNKYTVTFYDEDGQTVLGTSTVDYGRNATYTGSTPTKEATQELTYTFSGWDTPEKLNNVTENRSVKATYSVATNKYTVTFYDEDGQTVLGTSTVDYGKNVTYTGSTPIKAATAQYTYTFNGWDDETKLENVTENRSVKATYSATTNQYTVTFYDEDGQTVLGESTVEYGKNVTYEGETPSKAATEQEKFAFEGWNEPEKLKNVTNDRRVNATFSPVPVTGDYELIFKDEFDDIDTNTWKLRTGSHLGGINKKENVFTDNGTLKIEFGKDDEGNYTGGGVISKQLFGYGYYEIEAKLFAECGGFHSAFWIMGGSKSTNENLPQENLVIEIDGFEFDSNKPENINFNMFYKIGSSYGNKYLYDGEVNLNDDQFHKFGFEWLPDKINYYMDGKLMHTNSADTTPFFYAQQSLWLTGLANTVLSGSPNDELLPGYTEIKYVKFYAKKLQEVNLIGSCEFEYNENIDFDEQNIVDKQNPISFCENGDIDCSFVEKVDDAYAGRYVLTHRSNNNESYKVDTYQTIYNIPNGNYELSVWVKSGGTHESKKVIVTTMGANGEEISIEKDIPTNSEWTELKIENIKVINNQAMIKFSSDAKADGWIQIDNPSFYATSGEIVNKVPAFDNSTRTENYIGEIYYNVESEEFENSNENEWKESSIIGSKKNSMYILKPDESDYAQWSFVENSGDSYALQYYNIESNGKITQQKVEVLVNDEIKYTYAVGNVSGWETLGNINLEKGDNVIVRTSMIDSTNTILRVDSIRLIEPLEENRIKYSDVIIMNTKQNCAFIWGVRNNINNIPLPKINTDIVYIPYDFIKQYIIDDGLEQNNIKPEYVSVDYIEKYSNYTVTVIDNEYVIIHPKNTSVLDKFKSELIQIF